MIQKTIVDTSIWIDYFLDHLPTKLTEQLSELIEYECVVLTDIIYFEILIGAKTKTESLKIKDLLSPFLILSIEKDELDSFIQFGQDLRKKGLLGKYTDLSIAYLAHKHKLPILSLDHYFKKLTQLKIL